MRAAVPGFRTDFLQQGRPLGVAVSGGADSIALLHLLREIRSDLIVLHVNHGLRGDESENDQQFVEHTAAKLGLSCLVHRPELGRGNQEQAARNARYTWFRQLMEAETVGQVATGHTEDDQAETVLFRFLRGSGTAGLAAILPRTEHGIVRPLLHSSRSQLRGYLESRALQWREDSSNNWLRFDRNRIRRQLLPELQQNWNPNLTVALAQTAEWARAEEEYWQTELPRLTQDWVRFYKLSAILSVAGLNQVPLAAARRIIKWALHYVCGSSRNLEFSHIERVLHLAGRSRGCGSFRTAQWEAVRSFGLLRLARPVPLQESSLEAAVSPKTLNVPGACLLADGSAHVTLELKSAESVYNNGGLVDWSLIRGSLELRDWRPGDRFLQAGHTSARKLKYFFQEAGIPSWERLGWPVITCENSILWVRGQGVSAAFAPSAATTTVLQISEVPCSLSGKTANH